VEATITVGKEEDSDLAAESDSDNYADHNDSLSVVDVTVFVNIKQQMRHNNCLVEFVQFSFI